MVTVALPNSSDLESPPSREVGEEVGTGLLQEAGEGRGGFHWGARSEIELVVYVGALFHNIITDPRGHTKMSTVKLKRKSLGDIKKDNGFAVR